MSDDDDGFIVDLRNYDPFHWFKSLFHLTRPTTTVLDHEGEPVEVPVMREPSADEREQGARVS